MCMYVLVFACILAVSCCMPCLTFLFAVSLGCFHWHDDVGSEPGSWLVVGMIIVLVFNKRKSTRGPIKRPLDCPKGALRRRIHLMHQCLGTLMEGWNALTDNKSIQCADGVLRRTRILLAAICMDQPEAGPLTTVLWWGCSLKKVKYFDLNGNVCSCTDSTSTWATDSLTERLSGVL